MKAKKPSIITILDFIFWFIFIGLLIQTGAILFSFFVSLKNPDAAKNLYLGLDLSNLYSFNKRYYTNIISFIIFLSALKAYLAYLVIRIFWHINFDKPFNSKIATLITQISYYSLAAGVAATIANGYDSWLSKSGVNLEYDWGHREFIFLAAIIYVISYIFKKGVEIQTESELTV